MDLLRRNFRVAGTISADGTRRRERNRELDERKSWRPAHTGMRRELWAANYLSRASDREEFLCANRVYANCHRGGSDGHYCSHCGTGPHVLVVPRDLGNSDYGSAWHGGSIHHSGLGATIHLSHTHRIDFFPGAGFCLDHFVHRSRRALRDARWSRSAVDFRRRAGFGVARQRFSTIRGIAWRPAAEPTRYRGWYCFARKSPSIAAILAHIDAGSASNISYASSNRIEVKGNSHLPARLPVRPAIMRGLPAAEARIWIRE